MTVSKIEMVVRGLFQKLKSLNQSAKMENRMILGVIVLAAFVFIVSLASLHAQSEMLQGNTCGCSMPVYFLIPMLSSLGLLVGSVVYYLVSRHCHDSGPRGKPSAILDLLEGDEKKIVKAIIDAGGETSQSKLPSKTGLSRVAVSRTLSDLEQKGVVQKKDLGVTNWVKISKDLMVFFV